MGKNIDRAWIIRAGILGSALAAAAGTANAQIATCGSSSGPDVIVGDITGPSNFVAAGGIDAFSLGTTSCNMGNAQLRWDAFPANTHPAIGGNMYKYKVVSGSGRFEQIGQSWLKHGFAALTGSVCCTCQSPGTQTRLGVGCSDPYTSSRNGTQSGLGPRWQVNAYTGAFPTSGPANPPWSGNTARRLEVAVADLEPSSATVRYFGEAHYVTPDDASNNNQNNNASYRELSMSGTTDFTTAFIGNTVRQRSAIYAWQIIDPSVTLTPAQVIDTSTPTPTRVDGLFIVGSRATDLGGGTWHYEYAVYNMNSDRAGGTFSIPVPSQATVTNIGFHGVTYRNGDATNNTASNSVNFSNAAWTTVRAGDTLTFSTDAKGANLLANAIRWGTTYNFRFDANIAPAAAGNVTLGLWTPGTPAALTIAAQVPGSPGCPADLDNGSGTGTPDGGVDINDLLFFLAGYEAANVGVADLDDGSGTGTPDGGVDINDLLFFLAHYESGC